MNIRLPNNGWAPRQYQRKLWSYLENGGKRAIEIAHRRWGKDDVFLHWAAVDAMQNVGNLWHMLPEYAQARKAVWTAVNPHTGRRRVDEAFPAAIRENFNEQEMFIRFKNGSTWQVLGSDNYKSQVGTAPRGIVYSEWSKANPGAWAYLAPILAENGGWAAFITTPEGRNHAHTMLEMARKNPSWHAEVSTVDDTGAISREVVEQQRLEYHALYGEDAGDALIEQEFFCSFEAAILGAYWGKEIARAEREGRICTVDRLKNYPVHTAWDIGNDDPMAVWVFQVGPGWLHVIDYVEGSNVGGFEYFVDWLAERNYVGGIDWVPRDARQHEVGAPGGRTRIQTLFALKRKPALVPTHKVMDRINAGRRMLPRVHFDAERCKQGIECLRAYKQEWDEDNRVFMRTPKHDWASHGADAWGHLSVAVEFPETKQPKSPITKVDFPAITVADLLRSSTPDRKWT